MAISDTPSANEINVELNRSGTAAWSMNGTEERALAGRPGSGTAISMNDFKGKSAGVSGIMSLSAAPAEFGYTTSPWVDETSITTDRRITINATSSWTAFIDQVYSSAGYACTFYIEEEEQGSDYYSIYAGHTQGANVGTTVITPFSYTGNDTVRFRTSFSAGRYYYKVGQTNTAAYYGLSTSTVRYTIRSDA